MICRSRREARWAAALLAGIGCAPLAAAQPAPAIAQPPAAAPGAYPYTAPWVAPPQPSPAPYRTAPYQGYGYRQQPAPTAPQDDPYPPGWDARGSGP